MNWKDISTLLLGSAAIGAATSAIFTLVNQIFERRARQRELLLTTAVDLSKTYMERVAALSQPHASVPEVVVLAGMHKAVKEVFRNGKLSQEALDVIKRAMNVV